MCINWIQHTKSENFFLYLYENSLKPTFKIGVWYKITLRICMFVFWIHKGYFVVVKLILNVGIKVFLYTNIFLGSLALSVNTGKSGENGVQHFIINSRHKQAVLSSIRGWHLSDIKSLYFCKYKQHY